MVICSENADCGKLEQNPATCYYLLVVKLVVKWEKVTTKDFQIHISNSVIVLTNSCNSVSVENFLNDFSSLLGCC